MAKEQNLHRNSSSQKLRMSDFSNLAEKKAKQEQPEEFDYGYDIMCYAGFDADGDARSSGRRDAGKLRDPKRRVQHIKKHQSDFMNSTTISDLNSSQSNKSIGG